MQKKLFLTIGPTSSCNHLAARIFVRMGCYGDFVALSPKAEKQLSLDKTAIHNEPPPDEPLCVLWRSIGYNGTYPDLKILKERFESYGYEVWTVLVMRDWSAQINSAAYRHKKWSWDETFHRTQFETQHIFKYASYLQPMFILNSSMLFKYPKKVIAALEEWSGLKFPEEYYAEIYDADEKWQQDYGEWIVRQGTVTVPNLSRTYASVPWAGSAGSINCGAVLPGLIAAIDGRTAIEIGIANGFTSSIIGRALSATAGEDGLLISVDINQAACNIGASHTKNLPIRHKVLCADSREVDFTEELEGRQVDLSYVDGNHDYEFAKIDVEKTGFLVVHDYAPGHPGVMNAVKELTVNGEWNRLLLPENGKRAYYQAIVLQKLK